VLDPHHAAGRPVPDVRRPVADRRVQNTLNMPFGFGSARRCSSWWVWRSITVQQVQQHLLLRQYDGFIEGWGWR